MHDRELSFQMEQIGTALSGATFVRVSLDADGYLELWFRKRIGGKLMNFPVVLMADPEGNDCGWLECRHVVDAITEAQK